MDVERGLSFDNLSSALSYRSNAALVRARLIFSILNKPLLSNFLINVTQLTLRLRLPFAVPIIKKTVFSHFCGGETAAQCVPVMHKLDKHHVKTVLDYSVEEEKTKEGFNKTMAEILHMLDMSKQNDMIPFCVFKMTGIADRRLLEKIANKDPLTTEDSVEFDAIKERLNTICARAHQDQAPILIDAEYSWFQDTVDDMVYAMMKQYNKDEAIVLNTFQMYRTDMLERLQHAHQTATEQRYFLGVKIVRGAYMETERKRALDMGYTSPILPDKQATDSAFNAGLEFCTQHLANTTLVCASHNEPSNLYLTQLMERHNIQKTDSKIWFLQLYGMRDNISFELGANNYNVGKYIPYGPAKLTIPYLMRRVEENTSVTGQSNRELDLIRKEQKRRKKTKNELITTGAN